MDTSHIILQLICFKVVFSLKFSQINFNVRYLQNLKLQLFWKYCPSCCLICWFVFKVNFLLPSSQPGTETRPARRSPTTGTRLSWSPLTVSGPLGRLVGAVPLRALQQYAKEPEAHPSSFMSLGIHCHVFPFTYKFYVTGNEIFKRA